MCDVTVIENKPRVYFISVLLGVRSYRYTDSTISVSGLKVERSLLSSNFLGRRHVFFMLTCDVTDWSEASNGVYRKTFCGIIVNHSVE